MEKRRIGMSIEKIRQLMNHAKIKWSTHCLERMQERDISIADVEKCILSGEIIEDYPHDFPHPSCLIFGYTVSGRILHVVIGTDESALYVITTYYPDTTKFMEDLKTRKV
jgi:uncharacterized DUF497 family protein